MNPHEKTGYKHLRRRRRAAGRRALVHEQAHRPNARVTSELSATRTAHLHALRYVGLHVFVSAMGHKWYCFRLFAAMI